MTYVVDITHSMIADLDPSMFEFFSLPDGGNGPFLHAAHAQGYDNGGSGWLTGNSVPIPEPCTMVLLGTSIAAAGLKRRKKS